MLRPWLLAALSIISVHARYNPKYVGNDMSQTFQTPLQLSANESVILDYGALTSGFPVLGINNATGEYVEILLTYSEGYPGILQPYGDGPYGFTSALANNFRSETVNITDVLSRGLKDWRSYFIQGSQRWQKIQLTQGTSLSLSYIGFAPTSATTQKQDASGDATLADTNSTFSCSNATYNRIWQLGPKGAQHACVRNGTQPSTWDLAGSDGVFIRGQHTGRSANLTGVLPNGYSLSFEAKIVRGGFGFALDAGLIGYGPQFYFTGNLSDNATYSTWNRTILPANTVTLGALFGLQNNSGTAPTDLTIPGYRYGEVPHPGPLLEGEWVNVTATSFNQEIYNLSLNGQQFGSINYSSYDYLPPPSPFYFGPHTIGLGGWQGQDSYYRNIQVADLNGTVIYTNPMTSSDIIGEYAVHTNTYSQCLDGGKRDRLVWLGDFYITATSMAVSTQDYEVWKGTLQSAADHIGVYGGVGTSNPMGIVSKYAQTWTSLPYTALLDYQLDFLNAAHLYYINTADTAFIQSIWTAMKRQIAFSTTILDPSTQLWAPQGIWKGVANGTAASAYFSYTMRNMAELADVLGESGLSANLTQQADTTANAVQTLLWNGTAGAFAMSPTDGNFSYIDLGMAILANISTPDQTAAQLPKLESLKYGIAYLETSATVGTPFTPLSPYKSGYLLEALGQVGATEQMRFLLDGMWSAMAVEGPNYSGATWEYVDYQGNPGLSIFTSLDHPWSSGATAVLTRYALGIRPTSAGYKTFTFAPVDLGLENANGTLQTPSGPIVAAWEITNSLLTMNLTVPTGTRGSIVPPTNGTFTFSNGTAAVVPVQLGPGTYSIVQTA